MDRAQRLGRQAEDRAHAMLLDRGMQTVTRNYRCRGGEIDLVMRDGDQLVFVEVRYRRHAAFGGAVSSIGTDKQRRLILAAQHFLQTRRWAGPCRFDVVAFDQDREGRWIPGAFTA